MPGASIPKHVSQAAVLTALALWVPWCSGKPVAHSEPHPPCGAASASPDPSHAPPGIAPEVVTWVKGNAGGWVPPACIGWPSSQRYRLVVALAGTFRHDGDADLLLARFGAISTMRGLRYWSVTDQGWRVLITDAAALDGPNAKRRRTDFGPAEFKSGADLFFAQADNRSSSSLVYRMRVLEHSANRIVIETENVDPVRLFIVPLFPPGSLRATYFLERRAPNVWAFYGLSGTAESVSRLASDHEASYINRAVALYRYLTGIPGDAAPPLAPKDER